LFAFFGDAAGVFKIEKRSTAYITTVMKKRLKIIAIIIAGLCAIAVVGRMFYMVICISCTSPPIQKYEFQGSVADLDSSLQNFAMSNPAITYKFSRRDSSAEEDNGDRDLEIELKKDTSTISYGLVCDQNENTTDIEVVSAFIKNSINGGYVAEAPGVKKLMNVFEKDFLVRFEDGDDRLQKK
jgi:hypothetical protein